eukprot:TRINITY_DN33000_c0_g1_i1.p1 TRINITY_DN33000_c0_g1~~TRINITY_DN33000_c0_g1_i1.p1  ORF type:complete len:317 (+),score=57.17 TRINITY_DN33000_c0_g1_i1:60-1010(+)
MATIGSTPIVEISKLNPNPLVRILAKCEFANPTGSMKDRIAAHIIAGAEKSGKLQPGGTIICASSGNTGTAVAMIAAMRGYKAIIICNEKTSVEKQNGPRAYGAEVVVTPSGVPADDPRHYQNKAKELERLIPGSFNIDQYDNPLNPEAYYLSLGPEIWAQTNGNVDVFVMAASTGGTISGTGRYLKQANPNCKVIMPDPHGSIFYHYWKTGEVIGPKPFAIEGVGKDSIPGALDLSVVDDIIQITDKQAFDVCRRLAREEGILVGGSAGANVAVALEIAKRCTQPTTIVTVLCDHGSKYYSKIYNDDWMREKGFA